MTLAPVARVSRRGAGGVGPPIEAALLRVGGLTPSWFGALEADRLLVREVGDGLGRKEGKLMFSCWEQENTC